MFQLRGLGTIDANKIGGGTLRRPTVMGGGGGYDVSSPLVTGPVVQGGSGGVGPISKGGTGYDWAIASYAMAPDKRAVSNPMPVVDPPAPYVTPPAPQAQPNPFTPPDQGGTPNVSPGTQVTTSAAPARLGKVGWAAFGLGILALGGALLARHHHG